MMQTNSINSPSIRPIQLPFDRGLSREKSTSVAPLDLSVPVPQAAALVPAVLPKKFLGGVVSSLRDFVRLAIKGLKAVRNVMRKALTIVDAALKLLEPFGRLIGAKAAR